MTGEPTTSGNPGEQNEGSDWAARITSTIVSYVGVVRDKTTGPALVVSRYAVYLLPIALILLVLLVIGFVLLVRALVVATGYAPFVEAGETWLAYYILGVLFLIAGAILWRKKESVN